MAATSEEYNPVSFYFSLSFTGAHTASDASFQEASGISAEPGVEEIKEDGENGFKHKLPAPAIYTNLVLKRGMVKAPSELADWCTKTLDSDISKPLEPKHITLSLLNGNAEKLMSWDFVNAFPVKWSVSDLKSQENMMDIETLEFAYSYFTRNQ